MKSIQTKILVVVIAGLLVITAVVSAIAVNMTHEVMHRDADRILTNATQREAAQINDVLGDVMKSSSIMEHYAVTELNSADDLKDEAFRAEYLQNAEVMFSEVALNTTDIEGFYLRLDPSVADGTSGFYKMLQTDYVIWTNYEVRTIKQQNDKLYSRVFTVSRMLMTRMVIFK